MLCVIGKRERERGSWVVAATTASAVDDGDDG